MTRPDRKPHEREEKGSSRDCLLIDFIGLVSSSSIRKHSQHSHTHRAFLSTNGTEERTVEDSALMERAQHSPEPYNGTAEGGSSYECAREDFVASTNNDTLMLVIRNSC